MKEPNYHDLFFREMMAHPDAIADFIAYYLPAESAAALDAASAELLPGTFVDEKLREHRSDLIYRVRLKTGGMAHIYLILEHKSYIYEMVCWQVMRYSNQTWEQDLKNGATTLTPILPVVFYHGAKPWTVETTFSSLFDWQGREWLKPYTPEFQVHLCDLAKFRDDEIKGGLRLRLALLTMKHIFDKRLNVLWQRLIELFQGTPERIGVNFLGSALRYIVGVREAPLQEIEKVIEATFPKAKEATMTTLTRKWFQEGVQEGIQQGIQQGVQQGIQQGRQETLCMLAQRLLANRFGALNEITQARIRNLSVESLDALIEDFFKLSSLDDLAIWLARQESLVA